ncbi:hypothetical protein EU537_03415 [Candidatus Thorarchaeota archaeon]|nr:MAG: hypothetical protein EU537_03415 [Candidatus Thorarchaeota archaeon]
MNPVLFYAMFVLAFFTIVACYIRSSKHLIMLLSLQATIVTMVSFVSILLDTSLTADFATVIKVASALVEWFFAAVVAPLILFVGVTRTENATELPKIGMQKTSIIIGVLIAGQAVIWLWIYPSTPAHLIIFAPIILVLSIDFVFILTRDDPFKVLVGLNIAETALFPFFEQAPLLIIPPLLLVVNLVNLVGVFIIYHGYREYGVLSISEWRQLLL